MRKQIEKRIQFTKEQKTEILNKSHCKCAKCGKALTVYSLTNTHGQARGVA